MGVRAVSCCFTNFKSQFGVGIELIGIRPSPNLVVTPPMIVMVKLSTGACRPLALSFALAITRFRNADGMHLPSRHTQHQ
jgi:hypothetical protein